METTQAGNRRKTRFAWSAALLVMVTCTTIAIAQAPPQPDAAKTARKIQSFIQHQLRLPARVAVDPAWVLVVYETKIERESDLLPEITSVALAAHVGAPQAREIHVIVLADGLPAMRATIPADAIEQFGHGQIELDAFVKRWQIERYLLDEPDPRGFLIQPWEMPQGWQAADERALSPEDALAAVGLTPPDEVPMEQWPCALQRLTTPRGEVKLVAVVAPTLEDARAAWTALTSAGAQVDSLRPVEISGHRGLFARRRDNVLYFAVGPATAGRKAVAVASRLSVGHQGPLCFVDSAATIARAGQSTRVGPGGQGKGGTPGGGSQAGGTQVGAGRAAATTGGAGQGQTAGVGQGTTGQPGAQGQGGGQQPGGTGGGQSPQSQGGSGQTPQGQGTPPQSGAQPHPLVGRIETADIQAVICRDVEDGKPVGAAARFQWPVDKIALYLKPKGLKLPTQIDVTWELGTRTVARQLFKLDSPKGSVITIFSRTAESLPAGRYTVTIAAGDKTLGVLSFEIAK